MAHETRSLLLELAMGKAPSSTPSAKARRPPHRASAVAMLDFLCTDDFGAEGPCLSTWSQPASASRPGRGGCTPHLCHYACGSEAAAASAFLTRFPEVGTSSDTALVLLSCMLPARRPPGMGSSSFVHIERDFIDEVSNDHPYVEDDGWNPDISFTSALKLIPKLFMLIALIAKELKMWLKLLFLFVKLLTKAIIATMKVLAKAAVMVTKFTASAVAFAAKLMAKATVKMANMAAKAAKKVSKIAGTQFVKMAKVAAKGMVAAGKLAAKAAKAAATKGIPAIGKGVYSGAKFVVKGTIAAAKMSHRSAMAAAAAAKSAAGATMNAGKFMHGFLKKLGAPSAGTAIVILSAAAAMMAASRLTPTPGLKQKRRSGVRRSDVKRAERFTHTAATKAQERAAAHDAKSTSALHLSAAKAKARGTSSAAGASMDPAVASAVRAPGRVARAAFVGGVSAQLPSPSGPSAIGGIADSGAFAAPVDISTGAFLAATRRKAATEAPKPLAEKSLWTLQSANRHPRSRLRFLHTQFLATSENGAAMAVNCVSDVCFSRAPSMHTQGGPACSSTSLSSAEILSLDPVRTVRKALFSSAGVFAGGDLAGAALLC